MLVLLHIKGVVVVPAEGHGVLQTLQAVLVSAAVSTVSHRRVSIWNELIVIWAESLPRLISTLFEDDDHEGTHQERRIALFVIIQACVVVDLVVFVLLVIHELLKFLAEQMHFAEVKRAKICKIRLVNQIVVNAEVKGVLAGLGWVLITDPVQATGDDFDRLVRLALRSLGPCFASRLYHDLFLN